MNPKYSMLIRWSEEDQAYLVWVPEFGNDPYTHGSTYEEAARMGQDLIESLIMWCEQDKQPLPQPDVYSDPEAAAGATPAKPANVKVSA